MARNNRTYKKSLIKRTAEILWDILAFYGLYTLILSSDRISGPARYLYNYIYDLIILLTHGS